MPDQWINAFSGNKTNVWEPQSGSVPVFGNSGLDQNSGTGENAQWTQGDQTGWGKQDGNNYTNWDLNGNQTAQGTNSVGTIGGEFLRNLALMGGAGMGLNALGGLGGTTAATVAPEASGGSWFSNLFGAPTTEAGAGVFPAGMNADGFAALAANGGEAPSFLQSLMSGGKGLLGSNLLEGLGGKLTVGQGLSSLYDMWSKNQTANAQKDAYGRLQGQVESMYAPGSPEAKLMEQEMARKDAAAGRNSQYGVRATDLAGKIAESKLRALTSIAPGQNTLLNQSLGNQYGGLNSLFGYLGKNNALASLPGFASQSAPNVDMLSNLFQGM